MMQDNQKNSWIDVHTHLHMIQMDTSQILKEAHRHQVYNMINIGTCPEDWDQVVESTKKFPVYGAVGLHPHEAKHYSEDVEKKLIRLLQNKKMVALGEIGLDYFYEHSDRKTQKEVFRKQMEVAKKLNLNVEIHTRSAEEDTIEILDEYKSDVQGLLHCFTGSLAMAKKALDIGYNISFSGIITFKKSSDLREVCSKVPLDRLHIETDAPYLAPHPHRGKQNQPAWLIHTAEEVAKIHCISLETLQEKNWQNADRLFSLSS